MPENFSNIKLNKDLSENSAVVTEDNLKDIQAVIKLQEKNSENVAVQSESFLADLYKKNLLRFGKNEEGEVIATLYLFPFPSTHNGKPLFHLGGTVTLDDSIASRRALLKLLDSVVEDASTSKVIAGATTSPSFANNAKGKGFIEISFEDMSKTYPDIAKAYLESEFSNQYNFTDKNFYILNA